MKPIYSKTVTSPPCCPHLSWSAAGGLRPTFNSGIPQEFSQSSSHLGFRYWWICQTKAKRNPTCFLLSQYTQVLLNPVFFAAQGHCHISSLFRAPAIPPVSNLCPHIYSLPPCWLWVPHPGDCLVGNSSLICQKACSHFFSRILYLLGTPVAADDTTMLVPRILWRIGSRTPIPRMPTQICRRSGPDVKQRSVCL